MREEENESEEGAVEDDYGSNEIGGFGEISGEIGDFGEIGKREERRCREKNEDAERKERTQMREKNEDERKEREKV